MSVRRIGAALCAVLTVVTAAIASPKPAGAAVGIWLTTSTRYIAKTYTISARVDATDSATADCPAAPGNPADGETWCAYITTDIQIADPVGGWTSFAQAKGAGPIPDNGPTGDGHGSFTLTSWCPTEGTYRSYFAQKVTGFENAKVEEWTDDRWNEPRDLACKLPPLEGG